MEAVLGLLLIGLLAALPIAWLAYQLFRDT
jgi:hypothetical protein